MIQQLKDRYKGATIAILGSGPTLDLYQEDEDIAIAVNGASLTDKKYHIFLAGDFSSPKRNWWLSSREKNNGDSISRIVSSYISPFDPVLYPDDNLRELLQKELKNFIADRKVEKHPYVAFVPRIKPMNNHHFFRFGGFGEYFVKEISPEQEVMYWGGTISAIALQLSLVLGANKVNIYGCGFDNEDGSNYHYDCHSYQKGITTDEQSKIMQATIDMVRNFGIDIEIYGKSKIV